MSLFTRAAATLAAATVVLAPSALTPAQATTPADLPHADSFYQYGATPPAGSEPGDPIDTRPADLTLTDLGKGLANPSSPETFPIVATQLLYRTQNELGHPSATVTTVIRPTDLPTPVQSKGVVAYLSYYDGLSDSCDPSYTLQGAAPSGEKAVIGSLLEQGYTVTVPDFEGETLDWAAGHEAGWSTLDAIRATEASLGLPATATKVGLIGYSGGSIAGEWASELAPAYAPELKLVGTAIGGVPANLRNLVKYVDSAADTSRDSWFGVIPAATVALGRATGKDFSSYMNATGQAAAAYVADKCIGDFAGNYPGKHLADLVNPGVDFLNEPDVKPIVDALTMGRGRIPTAPMLMVNGNKDGIGDGVMVAADVKALATTYCKAGLPVKYDELAGQDHGGAGTTFMVEGIGFLAQRFAGARPQDSCAALVANPKPVPEPKTISAKLKGHSTGGRDVLVVTAKGAVGAKVRIFRAGHKKALGHAVIRKNGKATVTVSDRNGRAVTRYRAVVAATATTKSDTTKVLRLR